MNRIALLTAVLTAAGAALQAVESTPPPANSSEPSSQPPVSGSHEDRFHREIAPLLGRACGSCHDPDTQEGGVVLTTLESSMDRPATVALWKKARKLIPSRTMPPADAEQLSA